MRTSANGEQGTMAENNPLTNTTFPRCGCDTVRPTKVDSINAQTKDQYEKQCRGSIVRCNNRSIAVERNRVDDV